MGLWVDHQHLSGVLLVSLMLLFALQRFTIKPTFVLLKRVTLVVCVLVGLALYSADWLENQLSHRLPSSFDKSKVELQLEIKGIEVRERGLRLMTQVQAVLDDDALLRLKALRRVRLNYYPPPESSASLAIGDLVNAQVVLRAPRNFANGLAFDYEAWLLVRGIDATGYIRELERLTKVSQQPSLRQTLLQQQQRRLPPESLPWVMGLVFADKQAFAPEQWQLAQSTGTIHLLVVSGLHIAMVVLLAWLVFAIAMRILAAVRMKSLHNMAVYQGSLALLFCALYVYLADAGVSLQRAWLMLLVGYGLWWLKIRPKPEVALGVAAVVILLINPLMITQMGFILSFSAVGSLLLYFSGRRTPRLTAFWLPHWVVFLGLIAPLMLLQGQVSLVHILANLIAVPWVSLVILPLSFAASLLPFEWLSTLLAMAGTLLWDWLAWLDSLPISHFFQPLSLWWIPWLLLLGVWVRGLSWPLNGLVWLVPIWLLWPSPQPNQVTLLDVGQGLSLVFTDEQQALIYDTGARFSKNFDMGNAVVVPVLRQLAIEHSTLVVSHADNDHSGGAASILDNHAVTEGFAGQPRDMEDMLDDLQPHIAKSASGNSRIEKASAEIRWQDCHQGYASSNLDWHHLTFQMKFRFFPVKAQLKQDDNNHSCVMQVDWYGHRFLLPGDIDKRVERWLVKTYGDALKADVLVVAHHGSRTSSSLEFLEAVQPMQAWISAGFNNRFRHPHPKVVERIQSAGIELYQTAVAGRLRMNSDAEITSERTQWQPPWRQP